MIFWGTARMASRRRKLRLFLAGYVNLLNSQNLNCGSLANALHGETFEVGVMTAYSGGRAELPMTVRRFHCFWPFRISNWIAHVAGILWCDVAYLPKREHVPFLTRLSRLLGKKCFTTIEGIFDDENYHSAQEVFGNPNNLQRSFQGFHRLFAISSFCRDYKHHNLHLKIDANILPLGVDVSRFRMIELRQDAKQAIFVGRLLRRKGVFELLAVAKRLPEIVFHFVGEGADGELLREQAQGMNNIHFHGELPQEQLSMLMSQMDVLCLLSRSEGFPKVILEAAACGVPSIVYPDYGADEWLEHGVNGFVVQDAYDVQETIKLICEKHNLLKVRGNARALAERYDWKVIAEIWEQEILALVET